MSMVQSHLSLKMVIKTLDIDKLVKKLFFLVIITECNYISCAADSSNFPSCNNIVMLLLASVIGAGLIFIYYPYSNIPPPPPAPGPGPAPVIIQPPLLNNLPIEQVNETLDMSSVFLRAFNNLTFFEIFSIGLLGFVGLSIFIFGVVVIFLPVLDWVRDHISLSSISDNSSRRLENYRIMITTNQYRLNHFNRLQHLNGYLTPEELHELNLINRNELLASQRALFNLLNNLNNNNIYDINDNIGNPNAPPF